MLLQNIIESKYHYQPSWVMIIIVLSLMVLGYLYSAFNSRFITFLRAVFVSRYLVQASREERSLSHPVSLLLSFNFMLIVPLFILQLFSSGTFFRVATEFSLLSFFIIVAVILCIYLVKILFLKILSYVLDKQELVGEYNFILFLTNQFLGILLLPVVIFIAYGTDLSSHVFVWIGTICFAAGFILRVGKGLGAVLERREATLFYLILYLCTLEILPLLIGVKLFEKLV